MEEITRELRELAENYLILFGCFTEEHFKIEEAEGNVSRQLSDFIFRWGWDRAIDRCEKYIREEC